MRKWRGATCRPGDAHAASEERVTGSTRAIDGRHEVVLSERGAWRAGQPSGKLEAGMQVGGTLQLTLQRAAAAAAVRLTGCRGHGLVLLATEGGGTLRE